MDEGKGKSPKFEELMKGLLPDGAAAARSASSSMSNMNNKFFYSEITSCSMWQQHSAPSNSDGRPNNTSQLSVDSNMYRLNLMQTSGGCSSTGSVQLQDPFRLVQQSGQSTLQNIMEPQCGTLPEQAAHPRLQMPAFHNLTQPMLLHDSSPQAELTSSIDWINEAYQNIRNMKEMYSADLHMFHCRAQEMRRRATNAEVAAKADRNKMSIERMMSFLNTSATDLLPMGREKVYLLMNNVMKNVQHFRAGNSLHAKPVEPHSEPASQHFHQPHQIQSLRQGGPLNLPQTSFNSFKIGSSLGLHKLDPSSTMNNASHYNPMRPTHQWASQGSPLRMLLHNPVGVNTSSQQPVVSSRNIFNSLDYSMPPLQNNQQDQGIKRQKMKQQMMNEKNKQQMFQKWNEDAKLRLLGGGSAQRWTSVLPPSPSPYAISPQQSSSQFELKDISTKLFKSAMPSLPPSSSALPSPLTPSSNPADSVSSPLIEESSKIAKSPGTSPQLVLPDKTPSQVSTDTQRLTKSCLHRESTGDKEPKHFKGDASKRLVEVVKKISYSTLKSTVRDISAVTTLTDRIAGHFLNGDSTKFIFHDLADEIKGGIPSFEQETGLDSRMKRKLDAEVLNDSITQMEFYESGRMKRLKKEACNQLLLKEIKEINKKLIEVVVDVMAVEDAYREGTLVRCSYIPIGLSSNIKTSTSKLMFPNLLLDLIVYADYPKSSPTVLEKAPSCFRDDEEGKYPWMKAKSSFNLLIKKLSEPISVKEMAEIWDVSAREVFHDFAEQIGEGSFASIYGKWENCAVAG